MTTALEDGLDVALLANPYESLAASQFLLDLHAFALPEAASRCRCQLRRRSTTGRVWEMSTACHQRLLARVSGSEFAASTTSVQDVFERRGWEPTLPELVGYIQKETPAPYAVLVWPEGTAFAAAVKTLSKSTRISGGNETYLIPSWLRLLLDVGTVTQRAGLNARKGPKGAGKMRWPTVLQRATVDVEGFRRPLVAACEAFSDALYTEGVDKSFAAQTIARFIVEHWPEVCA